MAKRFIPNGNLDFLTMAGSFARTVESDPARYLVSDDEARALCAAVEEFRKTIHGHSTNTRAKDAARDEAKRLIMRISKRIRANDEVDDATRFALGMSPEPGRRKARTCPQEPPYLRFVQALHQGSGATAVHELAFNAGYGMSQAKPEGAARLELFVGLIPPDQPAPIHPVQDQGTRVWYLRSYTRSPIKLHPPIPRVPMLVVYWGRWADSTGNVGPFCKAVTSRLEGLTSAASPLLGAKDQQRLIDVSGAQSRLRETDYSVAVIEAREQSMMPQLIEPAPTRQLEDHSEREAA